MNFDGGSKNKKGVSAKDSKKVTSHSASFKWGGRKSADGQNERLQVFRQHGKKK